MLYKGFCKVLFCEIFAKFKEICKKFHFVLAKKLKFCYNARLKETKI